MSLQGKPADIVDAPACRAKSVLPFRGNGKPLYLFGFVAIPGEKPLTLFLELL